MRRRESDIKLKTRLKFILGIFGVLLLVTVMLIRMQYDMSRVASQAAQLQATTYTIGSDFSGIVDQQFVNEGDTIHAGEKLFALHSPDLANALSNNDVTTSQQLYTLDPNGDVDVTAAEGGIVQKINYPQGAFVPANSSMAVIDTEDSTYVLATFKLTPPDYKELHNGNMVTVTFPDESQITGTAYGITLSTAGNQLYTTLKVRIDQSKINRDVFTVGTPVQANLHLDATTWYADIASYAHDHLGLPSL